LLQYFYLFQNNSPWNFSPIGVVQNRYPDVAFSGPDFQLPDVPLLVGLATSGGAPGVGRAVTTSVVVSAIGVFALDYFMSFLIG
jgi:hypothetical protein